MMMMRKLCLLVLLVVFGWSSGASATPYYDAVIADTPVSYWRLNDGAPGAIYSDPDTARSYDVSGALTIAYDPALNADVFSIEAWAQFNGSCFGCGFRTVLTSRGGTGHLSGYQIGANQVGDGSSGSIYLNFQMGGGGTWHSAISDPITFGEWYHIVGTYDGTTQTVFVNGQVVDSQASPFTASHGTPLRIGVIDGTNYFPMTGGLIDEVAYYNYALSGDRVSVHYQTGISAVPEPSTALLLGLGLAGMAIRKRR